MAIENEVDDIVRAQLVNSTASEESALETPVLMSAAHRLDNLIHHRRCGTGGQGVRRSKVLAH